MDGEFSFSAPVWVYEGEAAWYFVTLPRGVAAEVRECIAGTTKPFGSVKVSATLGTTRWKTSLFPDKKSNSYVLPIKAAVRQKEQVHAGMTVEVFLLVNPAA